MLGAAIGNTRRLRVKSTYEAPAILWTGIVGCSGSGKTPALRLALQPAQDHEARLQASEEPGRFLVGDTTSEALAVLMTSNPRGVLCKNDELAGWLGSIDRYTDQRGRCSADQAFLLSAYSGVPHTVDRRHGEHRHLRIPRASLWVTGGIQPGTLARAMGRAERDAGLLARLLLACPPVKPLRYSDADVTVKTMSAFVAVTERLFALKGEAVVALSPSAKKLWIGFHDRTTAEATTLGEDLTAAWSKFRDTALRIALILHCCRGDDGDLPEGTMADAVALTEWFKGETRRVYAMMDGIANRHREQAPDASLLAWMGGRDWVTERDVARGLRSFRKEGAAAAALRRLVAGGVVETRRADSSSRGGAPTMHYRVRTVPPPAPATEPHEPREIPSCVTVATQQAGDEWTEL
jgi:CRISPR-associated protein Cmr3